MKRILFTVFLTLFAILNVTASENIISFEELIFEEDVIQEKTTVAEAETVKKEDVMLPTLEVLNDGDKAVYSLESGAWYVGEPVSDDDIVITKNLVEGTGSYSQYYYSDDTLAMTFCSNYEFIKDGTFVVVNNENLTYSKLIYNEGVFEEVPIELLDLQVMFPDAELVRLSHLDADGKMWISKIPFKKKVLFFVNDTDKYFYKLTAKMKKLQPIDLRSYVVIPHYGFYTFTHFGERNGKIRIYTR